MKKNEAIGEQEQNAVVVAMEGLFHYVSNLPV
jgi:hypothetical protein